MKVIHTYFDSRRKPYNPNMYLSEIRIYANFKITDYEYFTLKKTIDNHMNTVITLIYFYIE